ncbi:MAG: hypothetical protein KUG77_14380 [Nannocystaceae bacterium]|nr:hypothetical protein [Nannocystaceae bacterium]
MLYAMLIHHAEGAFDHDGADETEALLQQHRALQADTKSVDAFVAATQLMEPHTSTVVRRSGDAITVQEGPFAETNEVFVGFYLLECESLEAAVRYAKRIPRATVEIRPVAYFEDYTGKTVGE